MKISVALALTVAIAASAQTSPKPSTPATQHAVSATSLPPFSGTWILNNARTHLQSAHTVPGESKAVITYDGKTWHYVHTHLETNESLPDSWQITLAVGSPKLHAEPGEGFTFHSRIFRQGNTLVMDEFGTSTNRQKVHNTIRYTLEDNNNTLVQTETSKGPLGTTVNRWVLEREGTGAVGSKLFGGNGTD